MAFQYIAIPKNVPDQVMTVGPLDGASYQMRFRWNMRGGWTIDVADESSVPIFGMRGFVLGVDFFARVRSDPRVPPGALMLVDLTGQERNPGYLDLCSGPTLSDLQGTCMLVYVTAE